LIFTLWEIWAVFQPFRHTGGKVGCGLVDSIAMRVELTLRRLGRNVKVLFS
jgi:hypothetical protein